MRRVFTLCAFVTAFSALALAESWTGKLIDSTCYDQQKSVKTCDATSATTMFAVDVSGTVYKLDSAGNSKAAEALKSRADRSANPSAPDKGPVTAKITGTKNGDTLQVETLDVP